jgi:hypothetical protein
VNTALSAIAADLDTGVSGLQWVVDAYTRGPGRGRGDHVHGVAGVTLPREVALERA